MDYNKQTVFDDVFSSEELKQKPNPKAASITFYYYQDKQNQNSRIVGINTLFQTDLGFVEGLAHKGTFNGPIEEMTITFNSKYEGNQWLEECIDIFTVHYHAGIIIGLDIKVSGTNLSYHIGGMADKASQDRLIIQSDYDMSKKKVIGFGGSCS